MYLNQFLLPRVLALLSVSFSCSAQFTGGERKIERRYKSFNLKKSLSFLKKQDHVTMAFEKIKVANPIVEMDGKVFVSYSFDDQINCIWFFLVLDE